MSTSAGQDSATSHGNMQITPLPWQEGHWLELDRLISISRTPHALMLVGPEEIGKLRFARALARRLLCTEPRDTVACGRCKQCQLSLTGNHPDIFNLCPEEPGKAIKVDAVRELAEFAAKTAQQGGWRVALIYPVEAMNINAANAFLKTLEEPGKSTLLILVCHQPGSVLPTIRSRCRLLTFPMPPRRSALPWLRTLVGNEDELAQQLLDQAGGRPLRALRFHESDLDQKFRQFTTIIADLENGAQSAIAVARQMQGLPETEALEWLQQHVYRAIYNRAGRDISGTRLAFLFLDRLTNTRRLMLSTANPNRQFLWEELLLDWRAVLDTDRA